ncbi:MAG: hypothetical protein V1725_01540 [archaeon]
MKEAEIQEKLKAGFMRARIIFEMIGNPKEHVIKTLKGYIANIKSDERIITLGEDYAEPEEMDDGKLWSTFCELEVLIKDLETFTWLCVNFSPASIEVLEPDEFLITNKDLGIWLNELLLRLHEIGIGFKQQASENELLKRNMNALVRNSVLLALSEPKTQEMIAKSIGVEPSELLTPFLEAMVKEGRIRKEGDVFVKA